MEEIATIDAATFCFSDPDQINALGEYGFFYGFAGYAFIRHAVSPVQQ